MRLDALIFGGGAAGLWLLDRMSRDGHHVLLLEAQTLGCGQTVSSQGIIHGGLKYTLAGLLTKSAKNIREMPQLWRDCLLGTTTPNLSNTNLRSGCCYLWQTDSLSSRAGMIGARFGLQTTPENITQEERPEALKDVPGTVARLPEQVISPRTFLNDLANQYSDRILKIDAKNGLAFDLDSPGEVKAVRITSPNGDRELKLCPRQVIFTAGAGNGKLRKMTGLSEEAMQRRPLHMVLVRGKLPELNGHCVAGAKTRVTVTSEVDSEGRMTWQLGGQLAEDGTSMSPMALTQRALSELTAVLPGIDFRGTEWTTYKVDRAEGATGNGSRPDNIQVLCAGNVTTGWPTKLVLAPVLAQEIASRTASPYFSSQFDTSVFEGWPRPEVALHPWEEPSLSWWKLEAETAAAAARKAA